MKSFDPTLSSLSERGQSLIDMIRQRRNMITASLALGCFSALLLWLLKLKTPSASMPGSISDHASMELLKQRLIALRPTLEEMMSLTGTAGAAYGVIYKGGILYTNSIGYRNVEEKLAIDEDTIFQAASLTKASVSAAIGMLVEDKALEWDTPLKDVLPEWHVQDSTVRESVTIVDCLAHRTGLQMSNYWLESNNNIVIPKTESMKFLNGLIPVLPFRSQYQYNNFGYEVAGHVIEKLTGMDWGEMLQQRLFRPLGLNRTGSHRGFASSENESKCYGALSNATPVRIGDAQIGNDTFAGAAGGVRSTLRDVLSLTNVWLQAADHQFGSSTSSTPGVPLKQVSQIMSGKVPTSSSSFRETSYALGWARTQLPGPMGVVGLNGPWLPGPPGTKDGLPIVGKASNSELVIYHQGSNPGVLAALNLLPERQAAVVVLTNTLALVDCADYMGQALLETILDVKDKNNYVQITKQSVSKALAWYSNVSKILRSGNDVSFSRPTQDYVGVYWNRVGTVHLDVVLENDQLKLVFQGLPDEKWELYPWKGDTLTWLPESRDAIARRGRFTFQGADYYKIKFSVTTDGQVSALAWIHEGWNLPDGEEFIKQ